MKLGLPRVENIEPDGATVTSHSRPVLAGAAPLDRARAWGQRWGAKAGGMSGGGGGGGEACAVRVVEDGEEGE